MPGNANALLYLREIIGNAFTVAHLQSKSTTSGMQGKTLAMNQSNGWFLYAIIATTLCIISLNIPVQSMPPFRSKVSHHSGAKYATILAQSMPPFRPKVCHHSGAKYATIPAQTRPPFRCKPGHSFRCKPGHQLNPF